MQSLKHILFVAMACTGICYGYDDAVSSPLRIVKVGVFEGNLRIGFSRTPSVCKVSGVESSYSGWHVQISESDAKATKLEAIALQALSSGVNVAVWDNGPTNCSSQPAPFTGLASFSN